MKIDEALPHIFNRTYPVLEPRTQMLLAVSLLRFHQIDALPIGFKRASKKRFAVFGFSCLAKLLETKPNNIMKFLEQPFENVGLELATISSKEDITSLLKVFEQTRFGFAWVEAEFETGGFASLRDFLPLYGERMISTDLSVGDVASKVFSMSEKSTIREALTEMFNHRFRRIFISETKSVVSDRRIIGYVFSTQRLNRISDKPTTMLDATLGDLESLKPSKISANADIKRAAKSMVGEVEECLICEKGIVTPWDLLMKPWTQKKLKIIK